MYVICLRKIIKKNGKWRKEFIQKLFRAEMGLSGDRPKTGGFGNSKDGNIVLRFFQNVDLSSKITGIDKDIMQRCVTILQAINSAFKIDAEEYTVETARKLVEEHLWYYRPPSVHKIQIQEAG